MEWWYETMNAIQEKSKISYDELIERMWVKLKEIVQIEYSGDYWSFQREKTSRHLLIVATSERARVVIDGRTFPTRNGTILACRPGQWVETGTFLENEPALYLIYYDLRNMGEENEYTSTLEEQFVSLLEEESYLPDAVEICKTMYQRWQSTGLAERLHAQASFHELLALLINKQGQETMQALSKVKTEIDCYYYEEISIERLVALSGISRYHLMRIFKERYGKSIVEYITEIRLHHAKKLMLGRDCSISEIAKQVGFQSEPYFRTVFKKQVGIAPAMYLRNRERRVAAYSWPILGQLLPLQIVPYAAPLDHYWTNDFSRKYDSDVVVALGHQYDFNRNALRLAQPDCIIGLNCTISPEEEVRLNEIAPVLLLPWMEADWRRHLQLVAEFVDRQKEATQWLERYDYKIKSIKERIHSIVKNDKVLVLKISMDRMFIWGRKAMTVLYDDLQLTPSSLVDGIDWFEAIDLDRLFHCDAGRIMVSVDDDTRSHTLWRSLQRSEQWNNLRAIRNGALHILPGNPSWVYPWLENTAFNHERFLDAIPKLFLCDYS